MAQKVEVTGMSSLLPTLLLVLFVGLKLAGVIAWSWWWVLAPFWIPLVLALLVVIPMLIYVFVAAKKGRKP